MPDFSSIIKALESDFSDQDWTDVDTLLWIKVQGTDVHPSLRTQPDRSHKTQIDLTYGGNLPSGESPVDDFFPYLKKPSQLPVSRRLKIVCRYLSANLSALGAADTAVDLDYIEVTGLQRNEGANPSLQVHGLETIRKLLPEGALLLFVHKKDSKDYVSIGVNKVTQGQTYSLFQANLTIGKKLYKSPDIKRQTHIFEEHDIIDTKVHKIITNRLIEDFKSQLDALANLSVTETSSYRLVASLLTKPFLILTGLSGSGKTQLSQAFSKWITAKPEEGEVNPRVALIPVGADWMGNENILGYPNGLDQEDYISKPALELILHAGREGNEDIPHFLILDEMNLSHVERYFADILSAIESGESIPLYQGENRKAGDTTIPQDLSLPKNLFVIGTVNVDETTYMFSPKVLDRANVIEFRMEEAALKAFLDNPVKSDLDKLAGQGLEFAQAFVQAASDSSKQVPAGVKSSFDTEMAKFFNALSTEGAEFGYRTAYEASRFLHFYKLLGEYDDESSDWFDEAFDAVIVQKFLPKLHGSSTRLSPLLNNLWNLCQKPVNDSAAGDDGITEVESQKTLISVEAAKEARYKMSAAKIARMIKVLNRNGFVSFAEA